MKKTLTTLTITTLILFSISFISAIDFTETISPNIFIKSSSTHIAGDISLIKDNDISTFYGIGENQHHGGSANMTLTYIFPEAVNIENINYTRSMYTAGSSSDTERQIEKVTIWDSSGQTVIYDRNVVYGGSSGTATGGKLDTKNIQGSFNNVEKIEFSLYASSSGGSSDRFTRIRLYEIDIKGNLPPECSSDSDCGPVSVNKVCDINDSVVTTTTPKCNSAKKCEIETNIQRETCFYGCSSGECIIPPTPICCNDLQCGTNKYLNQLFCKNNNSWDKFLSFTCNNAGQTNSFCSNSTTDVKKDDCAYGCSNGLCKNETITCSINSQCGTDGYIGNKYCTGNNSYQNYKEFTCNNPGQTSSSCSNVTTSKKIEDCDYGCTNGICNPQQCCSDSECPQDNSSSYYCKNKDVYYDFQDFFCSNGKCDKNITSIFVKSCSFQCSNGNCENQTICSNNSQCGTDQNLNQLFCKNKNSYDKFLSFTCSNPGQTNSFCSNSTTDIKIKDCAHGCSNGKCDNDNKGSRDESGNLCGDLICDAFSGESEITCPEDCDGSYPQNLVQQLEPVVLGNASDLVLTGNENTSFTGWWIILVIAILLIILLIIIIKLF